MRCLLRKAMNFFIKYKTSTYVNKTRITSCNKPNNKSICIFMHEFIESPINWQPFAIKIHSSISKIFFL